MRPMILLTSHLSDVFPCLRAGDRKSSATNSRQSADRHYQAIGANRTQRRLGRSVTRRKSRANLYVKTPILNSILSGTRSQWRQASA